VLKGTIVQFLNLSLMIPVSGLDLHKDTIFMCILDEQGKKIEEKIGVTTREIKRMSFVMRYHYVSYMCMELYRETFLFLLGIPSVILLYQIQNIGLIV